MGSFLSPHAPPPRAYQSAIAAAVLEKGSSLVVLPTGLGKTLVALLVMDGVFQKGSLARALFLAPTRPLAAQHEKTVREMMALAPSDIALVSGLIDAQKRAAIYASAPRVLISTPQTIANDLRAGRLAFDFALVVVDECHRAVGRYAYTYVARAAQGTAWKPSARAMRAARPASTRASPRRGDGGDDGDGDGLGEGDGPLPASATDHPPALVLGLTASPGGQKSRIEQIVEALGIHHVQIRSSEDADVAPYVKPLEIQWIPVELPAELAGIKTELEALIGERALAMRKMGFVGQFYSKKALSEWRARILQSKSPLRFSALSQHASLFSYVHLLELLETQGVESVLRFLARMEEREPSQATARVLHNPRLAALREKLKVSAEHPKLAALLSLVQARGADEKTMVFCQYRDQVGVLVRKLTEAGLRAQAFMGKKDGVTAKDQQRTLEDFRAGKFDILVATSIGEEGLDIPSVDNVIFYEPVPSEIRSIQRRGRAGRAKMGRMFGLMTLGTRDQAFFHSARRREERMRTIVGGMSKDGVGSLKSAPRSSWGGGRKKAPTAESDGGPLRSTLNPAPPRPDAGMAVSPAPEPNPGKSKPEARVSPGSPAPAAPSARPPAAASKKETPKPKRPGQAKLDDYL